MYAECRVWHTNDLCIHTASSEKYMVLATSVPINRIRRRPVPAGKMDVESSSDACSCNLTEELSLESEESVYTEESGGASAEESEDVDAEHKHLCRPCQVCETGCVRLADDMAGLNNCLWRLDDAVYDQLARICNKHGDNVVKLLNHLTAYPDLIQQLGSVSKEQMDLMMPMVKQMLQVAQISTPPQ